MQVHDTHDDERIGLVAVGFSPVDRLDAICRTRHDLWRTRSPDDAHRPRKSSPLPAPPRTGRDDAAADVDTNCRADRGGAKDGQPRSGPCRYPATNSAQLVAPVVLRGPANTAPKANIERFASLDDAGQRAAGSGQRNTLAPVATASRLRAERLLFARLAGSSSSLAE